MATCSHHSQRACTWHSNSLPHWKRYFDEKCSNFPELCISYITQAWDTEEKNWWWWKFSTQKSKVAAMYCDVHRHIHSWLHFKHYHVGKSNMVPTQPVRRFVCWSIIISIPLQKAWKILGVIFWTVWEIAYTFQFQIKFLTKILTGKMAQGCAEVVHTFGKL